MEKLSEKEIQIIKMTELNVIRLIINLLYTIAESQPDDIEVYPALALRAFASVLADMLELNNTIN